MASALVLAATLIALVSSTSAYDFYVGGRDGWVQNPKENYNSWAARMRFQVNDKLVFKYNKDDDSVLVVTKEGYDSCNTSSPIQKLQGGDSTFQFPRSGPFYFISGVSDRCAKGEKLIAVVMAPRNKKPAPPPPPPSASPPSISPSPAPAKSPSPSPNAPTPSPSPSPSASPSPSTPSPSSSPTPSPGTSPSPSSSEVSPASGPSNGGAPPNNSSAPALTASSVAVGLFALFMSRAILG